MRPSGVPLLLPLLAGLLFGSGALAAERASKASVSVDGRFVIRLVEESPGRCRLEVTQESGPHWTLPRCVGTPDDFFFVSTSGERFWVVRGLSEKPLVRRRSKRQGPPPWVASEAAVLFDRYGKRLKTLKVGDFVKTGAALADVRELGRRVVWLEGVAGIPGQPPRLLPDNKVELDTVEPKRYVLGFEE